MMLGIIGVFELMLAVPVMLLGILGTVFWIWMLIDCATKESSQGNEKIVWILVIVLTHVIGALIYLIVRRPQRMRELGA